MEKEKTTPPKPKPKRPYNSTKTVEMWSVQCGECFKWRIIPTQEEYEQIRSKFIEDPFVCTNKSGVSCDDPADLEYDKSQIWVIDKPNLPKTPPGFKRRMVMRSDYSRMDCYYSTPDGKKLRATTDVVKFLDQHPEYKNDISANDFSFTSPKVMESTCPEDETED
ncbi:Methyl-CpG-binding domain protein 4 [Castilleja foliolosa]|uniref:Methyl-CpG-binding domain protein 4 n=1 Tax=Castilleja foliolosa TaxID=1961234 RepID=A0ABD3C8Z8_9LAMI